MPRSAFKPCRFAGCGALTAHGTLCDLHKPMVETCDDRRAGSSRRGYDRHWRNLRAWYIRRHPVCEWSGCREPASQVDHIVPLSRGGAKSDLANLQSLCRRHHSIKTTMFDGGFGRRRVPMSVKNVKVANNANSATPDHVGTLDSFEGTHGGKDSP